MKKLALSLVPALLLCSLGALAQDSAASAPTLLALTAPTLSTSAVRQSDADTMFDGDAIEHSGWYVAPSFGFTSIDGGMAVVVGLRSAWTINRQFGIGLTVNGLSNEDDDQRDAQNHAEAGYGGLLLQYIIGSNDWVHGFVDTTIAGGAVCVQNGPDTKDSCREKGFFALEPTLNMEFNLTPWARAAVGGGYRLAIAEQSSPVSNRELGGLVVRTSVAFGMF